MKYLTRESPGIIVKPLGIELDPPEMEYVHESDPSIGGGAWMLDVGAECNLLLEHASKIENGLNGHPQIATTIRSIVHRVAEFDELEVEP